MNFADRLIEAMDEKKSNLCVGIDPRLGSLPEECLERGKRLYGNTVQGALHAIREWAFGTIDVVKDIAAVAKPQLAFFEVYGSRGYALYEDIVKESKVVVSFLTEELDKI